MAMDRRQQNPGYVRIRFADQASFEKIYRFWVLAELKIRERQPMQPNVGEMRVKAHGAIDPFDRFLGPSRVVKRQAQDGMRAGKVWFERDRPLKFRDGLIVLPLPEENTAHRNMNVWIGLV